MPPPPHHTLNAQLYLASKVTGSQLRNGRVFVSQVGKHFLEVIVVQVLRPSHIGCDAEVVSVGPLQTVIRGQGEVDHHRRSVHHLDDDALGLVPR